VGKDNKGADFFLCRYLRQQKIKPKTKTQPANTKRAKRMEGSREEQQDWPSQMLYKGNAAESKKTNKHKRNQKEKESSTEKRTEQHNTPYKE
jgi:hypothetical protein